MTLDESQGLEELAGRLPQGRSVTRSRVHYDVVAGALFWTDEEVNGLSADAQMVLRKLLRHRSMLLIGSSESEYEELWAAAHQRIPNWVGFQRERTTPSTWWRWRYRLLERRAIRTLNKMGG